MSAAAAATVTFILSTLSDNLLILSIVSSNSFFNLLNSFSCSNVNFILPFCNPSNFVYNLLNCFSKLINLLFKSSVCVWAMISSNFRFNSVFLLIYSCWVFKFIRFLSIWVNRPVPILFFLFMYTVLGFHSRSNLN